MTSDEIRAAIDRLKAIPCDDRPSVYSVTGAFMDMYMNAMSATRTLRDQLIELLEQADPDTHMELPKDADGVPFRVGDEIVNKAGSEVHKVVAIGGPTGRTLWLADEPYVCHPTDYFTWECYECRHYHKPTVEDVLTKMANEVYDDAGNAVRDRDAIVARYTAWLREVMQDD